MKTLRNLQNSLVGIRWNVLALFTPGVFLAMAGLAIIIAPRLVLALLGAFLLLVGVVFSVLVYKLLTVKSQVERAIRQFEGKVILHNVAVPRDPVDVEVDGKKVFFH
jgi:membrane protein implicated in regulation of membrane protease activity